MDGPGAPDRILLIRLGAMGDVLLATSLVRWLKQSYPRSRIDFLTKNVYVPLLETNPHLDRVLAFSAQEGILSLNRSVRRGTYGAVADLQGNFRSAMVSIFSSAPVRSRVRVGRVRRFLLVHCRRNAYREIVPVPIKYLRAVPFPVRDDGGGLELTVPAEAQDRADRHLGEAGWRKGDRLVALSPGAGRSTKRWPAERFAEAAQALSRQGYRIVLLGGPADRDVCRTVAGLIRPQPLDASARYSPLETAGILRRAELLLTNDTGIMHMACALDVKTVAVFGPTTRHFGFFPFRARAVVVEADLRCRPCSYHGTAECPKRHFRCMLDISTQTVLDRAFGLLDAR